MTTYAISDCTSAARITRSLLGYGVLAGPVYVSVSLAQALTRGGFDLSKHSWSLLANGDLGWIQITNFVVAGLATVAAAVGLRRAMSQRLVPTLIAAYGFSLVGAGVFRADPAQGFPAGTPETMPISWHGSLHGIASGSHGPTTLVFVAAVGLVWTWLATVCIHFYRALADAAA